MMETIVNEQVLAHGIVIQATRDYISYRRAKERVEVKLKKKGGADETLASSLKRATSKFNEIVRFFRSNWYKLLCNIDGEIMLEMLDKEYQDRNRKKTTRAIRCDHK
jgi:hypothetical protein